MVIKSKWYQQNQVSGRYKYLLLKQMTYKTRIHLDSEITFPLSPILIKLEENGTLIIEENYTWNGATGFFDLESMMRATLVHDALYQLIREGMLERRWRAEADRLLRDVCIVDGMAKSLAQGIYISVRIFGRYRV